MRPLVRGLALTTTLSLLACHGGGKASSASVPDAAAELDGPLAADAATAPAADAAAPDVAGPPDVPPDTAPADGLPATLEGTAQKGPLEKGSKVTLTRLDARGEPLPGAALTTTVADDLGRFSFPHPGAGLAEIVAEGRFFGEGKSTRGPLPVTLRALVDLAVPGRVHLNVITHSCAPRIRHLLRAGSALKEATAQAEAELRRGIGLLAPRRPRPATSVDLFGTDDDDSAYLLLLSRVFAGDPDVTRWLEMTAEDLEPDGVLTEDRWLFDSPGRSFDVPELEVRLRAFLSAQGAPPIVPNLLRVLDFDRDGISDFADPDADGDGVPATDDGFVGLAPSYGCLALGRDGRVWIACGRGPASVTGLERIVAIAGDDSDDVFALRDDGAVMHAVPAPEGGTLPWQVRAIPGISRAKAIFSPDRGGDQVPTRVLVIDAAGAVAEVTPVGAISSLPGLNGSTSLASSPLKPGEPLFGVQADGSVRVTMAADRRTGMPVPGLVGAASVFSGAFGFDCAIKGDGSVWCWEYQATGPRAPRPAAAMAGFSGMSSAAAHNGSVTLVKSDGTVWLWEPTGSVSQPPVAVPGITGALRVTPGYPIVVLDRQGNLTRHYHRDPAGTITAVPIPR